MFFETILIWRSSRKMNRTKSSLILYYLRKKFFKICNAQKNVFHAFCFQLCSSVSSKFSFFVSLCEINCIKIQTTCLVSKCIYFSRDPLLLIYFDVIIRQRLKKVQASWTFFWSHEWNKNMWSCATTDIGNAQRSYLIVA